MSDRVLFNRDGVPSGGGKDGVVTLTLNRPDKKNALDVAAWTRLGELFRELDAETDVRCVVLRGAGDALSPRGDPRGGENFSAGADISAFASERNNSEAARRYGEPMQAVMDAIGACRHPVVAAIRGVCVGGGLEIAAVCDLRIASRSSRFGIPVSRLGLTMSYGELRGLVDLVGPARALEVLLEGRIFDADEAKELGLVNRVLDDEDFDAGVAAAVERIATGAPLVHRWHKKFIRRLGDPRPLTAEEIAEGFACFDTEDFRIGYRAFLDKKDPSFKGR